MNVNWTYHLLSLTPRVFRKSKHYAWLTMMLKGLKLIHVDFLAWRTDVNLRASFTGQTMVLERMLNLHYYQEDVWATPDNAMTLTANGHIWIDLISNLNGNPAMWYESEGQPSGRTFYFESEAEPSPAPMYFASENQLGYSFQIMVPAALVFNEAEMRALLDRKLEAGYFYRITTY